MCLNHDQPCRICRLESIVVSYPSERHTHHKARRILGHLRCLGFWYFQNIRNLNCDARRLFWSWRGCARSPKTLFRTIKTEVGQTERWVHWWNRFSTGIVPIFYHWQLGTDCLEDAGLKCWASNELPAQILGRDLVVQRVSLVQLGGRRPPQLPWNHGHVCEVSADIGFNLRRLGIWESRGSWPLAGAMPLGWTFYIYDIYGLWPYDSPIGFNWRPEKSRRTWWDQKAAEWFGSFGSRNFGATTSRRVLLCLEGLWP